MPSSSHDRPVRRSTASALRSMADRQVMRVVNGLSLLTDASRPQMGSAPKDEVLRQGKLSVARLRPRSDERYEIGMQVVELHRTRFPVPILLIPPLMVRPYVYDLRPEHSMARTLRDRGFDVYLLDFGVPDEGDREVRLEDYVFDWVPQAVDAVMTHSGAGAITLAGYCMGGIFALLHTAANQDARVRNLVTIGSPVNFDRLGVLTVAARVGTPVLDSVLDRIGNVPAFAAIQGFKIMSGTHRVTKWRDLWLRLYDEEYVRAFDAINTWVNDLIPYPREAFRQMVKEVVTGNKILRRELTLGDQIIDVSRIQQPLLAFAGRSDNIAPLSSTREIVDLVDSTDKQLYEVPGGHVGVVAGSTAPQHVWHPTAQWLTSRSC